MSAPIRVTTTDPETGVSESQEIADDYCIVVAGTAYVSSVQHYANGTAVITVRGRK